MYDENSGDTGSGPLSDLFNSVLDGVSKGAQAAVESAAGKITASINTQPQPDLTAVAAQSKTATFSGKQIAGVSAPVLLLGFAALLYLAVRR